MTIASRHVLGLVLLATALALPAAQKAPQQLEQDIKKAEQQQKTITERLERVQKQVARDAQNLDQQQRELRTAEKSVRSARAALRELQQQRSERAAARQELLNQRSAKETERKRHQEELANQLRGAYFMGRNEPLQLLLNQSSTAQMSRMFTYYGYLGRQRAGQIDRLGQDVAQIAELTAKIEAEDAELALLEQRQKTQLGELDRALAQRGKVLASLEQEARSRGAQQAQLQKQKQALDKQMDDLLKQLARATESTPYDPHAPFAKVRGQLAWPVAGRITVDFGARIGADHRSDGIEIDARQGSEVRAVHEGRVLVADYFGSRGFLIVLDHGNGFVSLYAHNEQLFRQPGDLVKAGDLIATVGDSGGRPSPGLYFEIRSGWKPQSAGKPANPHEWFRSRVPSAR